MRGFTLIEVLVTSLLGIIILSGVSMYLIQTSRSNTDIIENCKIHNIQTYVSSVIEDDVRKGVTLSQTHIEELIITYQDETEIKYELNNLDNHLYKNGNKLVNFDKCSFKGSIFNISNNVVDANLNVILSYKNNEKEVDNFSFLVKCRNKKTY